MEGGARARTKVIAIHSTAKPSYGKRIFWEGLWKQEVSKELMQPESRRSCRRGTARGAACIVFAASELASLPKPHKHLRGGERAGHWLKSYWKLVISWKNNEGRCCWLQAGCRQAAGSPMSQGPTLGDRDEGHETGNLLLYFFFYTFCVGSNTGALIGRALPSALHNQFCSAYNMFC